MNALCRLAQATGRWLRRPAMWALLPALLAMHGEANALCVLSCSCNTVVSNVVFGSYNPLSSGNVDSTGSVKVSCGGTAGLLVAYTVSVNGGSSGNVGSRAMLSGANKLTYNLYTSAGYSTLLGDSTASSTTLTGNILLDALGIGVAQTWTVYGRIDGGQKTAVPGAYADTVTVTLTYF